MQNIKENEQKTENHRKWYRHALAVWYIQMQVAEDMYF
jgi:hypothetical protein